MSSTSGSLDQGALPGVLRDVYVKRRSGTLSLSRSDEEHRLYFHQGQLIDVGGPVADKLLAEAVLEQKLLEPNIVIKADGMARERGVGLGRILSEETDVPRDELDATRVAQARAILERVAKWEEGTFSFAAEAASVPGAHAMRSAPTGDLIVDTVRAIDDPDVVRFALGDLERPLAPSTDPLLRYQKVRLSPTEGFIMSRVDGVLSAQEVAQLVPASPEETLFSLCALHSAGLVDFVEKTPRAPAKAPVPPTPTKATSSPAPPAKAPPSTPPAPRPLPPPLPSQASSAPPDKPAPPAPPRSEPPAAAPRPPQEVRAHEAPPRSPQPEERPPGPVQVPESVPLGATPVPVAGPGQEERRKEIAEAYANLKSKTHFDILGLERTATDGQVKEAYFRLARRFHPDVLRGSAYADLSEQVEAIFIRLGQAYEVLRNRNRRSSYESTLPKPAAPEPPPDTPAVAVPVPPSAADLEIEARLAADGIRQAEKLLEKEKYWDAIQLAEGHFDRAAPKLQQRARLVLAKSYLKNPNWAKRAEEQLLALVEDDPKHVEGHFLLGIVYKEKGIRSRALSRFRKVLELKPDHEEARALVLELEPPPEPDQDEPKGGFVKRLFGRGGS